MFSIGFQELLLIFIVALIVFGPRKLPELGRLAAQIYREAMSFMNEFKSAVDLDNISRFPRDEKKSGNNLYPPLNSDDQPVSQEAVEEESELQNTIGLEEPSEIDSLNGNDESVQE